MPFFLFASLAAAQAAAAKPPAPPPPVAAVPAPSESAPDAPKPGARAPSLTPSRGVVPAAVPSHAVPRVPLQSLITMDDYPAAALSGRDQGTARFMLTVDAAGRVSGCVVLTSTGSTALDIATCRIMRARARFTPARDASGQPVEERYWDQVAWRLRPGG